MKFPCEFFLRHLLVMQKPEAVAEYIQRYGYPEPSLEYLEGLKVKLEKSRPAPFIRKSHRARAWLRKQRIASAYNKTDMMVKADRWTRSSVIRSALETLLIAGLSEEDISFNIGMLTGTDFELEAVQLYAHYFWNRDVMTYGEWQTFLEAYPNGRELRYMYTVEPMVALWKVGVIPDIDDADSLAKIHADSYVRMQELNTAPNTLKTAMTYSYWSTAHFRAIDEKRQGSHALTRILHHMHEMTMLLRSGKIPDGTPILDEAQILKIPERV